MENEKADAASLMPSEIQVIPQDPEIPREIEQGGVQTVPVQFTATVQDDSGNQLISSSQTNQVTVQIPASKVQLDDWAKGDPDSSLTWFAAFWLRIIKKALFFNWKAFIAKGPDSLKSST